jgi:hypothetical protein
VVRKLMPRDPRTVNETEPQINATAEDAKQI